MTFIKDGTGTGSAARVDSTFRLHTRAVSESRSQESAVNGDGFNVNTGIIPLTVDTESAVLYYKHGESKDLIIDSIIVGIEDNGTDVNRSALLKIYENPVSGSIISGATKADIIKNRNFYAGNSSVLPNSIAYKGGDSLTLSGGDLWADVFVGSPRTPIPVDIVMSSGASIGISLDLQANTLGIDVYVALVCHLRASE